MSRSAIASALYALLFFSNPGYGETLREAVIAALAVNPDVRMSQARVGVAHSQFEQSRAGARPTLDFHAGTGREETDSVVTRSQGKPSPFPLSRNDESLSMRWMLYDGNQVSNDIKRSTFAMDSQQARLSDAREMAAQDVVNAYLNVLREQDMLEITESLVKAHAEMAEKTSLRFKRGVGTRADAQLSEGRFASASNTLISQQARLAMARAGFQRAVEHQPEMLQPVTPPAGLPATEQQAQDEAIAQHANCRAIDADIAAAEAAKAAARGKYSPEVALELAANRSFNAGGMEGENNIRSAMLQLHYNLYRGGGDRARVRELEEQLNVAVENRHKIHVAIRESVSRAWIAVGAVRSRLDLLGARLASTEAVLEAYRAQYEVNRRTLIDTLNAESEMYQARIDYASARYELLSVQYQLLAAMGGLVRSFGLIEEKTFESTAND